MKVVLSYLLLVLSFSTYSKTIFLDCYDMVIDTTNLKIYSGAARTDPWDLRITPYEYIGYREEYNIPNDILFKIDRRTLEYWQPPNLLKDKPFTKKCKIIKNQNKI